MKKSVPQLQLEERIKEISDMGFKELPDGDYQENTNLYVVTRREIDSLLQGEWDDFMDFIKEMLK